MKTFTGEEKEVDGRARRKPTCVQSMHSRTRTDRSLLAYNGNDGLGKSLG